MNRNEFVNRLEEALEGVVSPQVIASNKQYYQNYILDEVSKGRSEAEVLEELGDPRLIARTIFDSQEAASGHYGEQYAYEADREESRSSGTGRNYGDFREFGTDGEQTGEISLWQKIRPTVILVGIVVVILAVLSVVFSMAFAVLTSPIFWIIVAVFGISRVFLR